MAHSATLPSPRAGIVLPQPRREDSGSTPNYILFVAAVISFGLGQLPNGIFIVAVLLVNALIGTIQEYSAQRAAAALKNMVRGVARVVRDGTVRSIDVEEVVPGDLVLLSSGDKVPADLSLISTRDLAVDESMPTGESLAVTKNAGAEVATLPCRTASTPVLPAASSPTAAPGGW